MKHRKIKYLFIVFSLFFVAILFREEANILKRIDAFHNIPLNAQNNNQISFSQESGYYREAFKLKIETDIAADIYYTLDGSIPTNESEKYVSPILISDASENENTLCERKDFALDEYYIPDYKIDKATIVRAALYDTKRNVKLAEKTATYFVGLKNSETLQKLPVVSIIIDPKDMFDERTGIYVNGEIAGNYQEDIGRNGCVANWNLQGEDWERPASIEYFDENFSYICSENVGLRIRGQNGRRYVQKGFNLYAGEQYGNSGIKCFWNSSDTDLEAVSLLAQYDYVKVKEWLASSLAEGLNIGSLQCYPCSVFLNGEYWGVYFVYEKFDENYFLRHYNIKKNNLIMVKNSEIKIGNKEDITEYGILKDYVKSHDMSVDTNLNTFFQMVDLDSLLDYYCFECYINNIDWPNNNFALWRTRIKENKDSADKKWRFLLFDTNINECMDYSSWNSNFLDLLANDDFMPYLLQNMRFRSMFANRMCDMANMTFDHYKIESLLNNMGETIEENVSLEKRRFTGEQNFSVRRELEINQLPFFYERANYIRKYLCEQLYQNRQLASVVIINDNMNAGYVKINSIIPDLSYGSWEGIYISGLPVSVCAVAEKGYRFKEWNIISNDCLGIELNSDQFEVALPEKGFVIQPVFELEEREGMTCVPILNGLK